MVSRFEAEKLNRWYPDGLDESAELAALTSALPHWQAEINRLAILRATGTIAHVTERDGDGARRISNEPRTATKTYTADDAGTIRRTDFDAGFRFFATATPELHSVDDVAALLRELIGDPAAFIIRGALRPGLNPKRSHRRTYRGDDAAFVPAPCGRRILTLDIDKLPVPAGIVAVADPRAAAEFVRGLLPLPLRSAACAYAFSSSTGFAKNTDGTFRLGARGTVSMHLLFVASRPLADKTAENWAKEINAEAGRPLLDPATLRTVQPYYTAAPICRGFDDPMPADRRIGTLPGTETVAVPDHLPSPGEWWASLREAELQREAQRVEQAERANAAKERARENAAKRGASTAEANAAGEAAEGLPDWRQPDLYRYFRDRGELGAPLPRGDGFAIRCPWHALHSDGRDGLEGDTAIIRNTDGPGWHVVCQHGSHGGRGTITNRDIRADDPNGFDAVCPRTYFPPTRHDADGEAADADEIDEPRPFVLPPIPPGTKPFVPQPRADAVPAWLDSTAGANGVHDRLTQTRQTAPGDIRPVARALAASGEPGIAAGVLSRAASKRRFGELTWAGGADGKEPVTKTTDNDLHRHPRWHPLDAWGTGNDVTDALLATLGLIHPTTRDADADAPPTLNGHALCMRTLMIAADDFASAKTAAGAAIAKLAAKRVLPADAGCLVLIDRGHSRWAPHGVELPVVFIFSAPTADGIADVASLLSRVTLPDGALWVESAVAPTNALRAAKLAKRIVEAVPLWATTAAAVADSLRGFHRVRLIQKFGAIRAAWREPLPDPTTPPDDALDVLNIDECEADADADPIGVYADITAWKNNAEAHRNGRANRRPVVRSRGEADRNDPAILWRVEAVLARVKPYWSAWVGGARVGAVSITRHRPPPTGAAVAEGGDDGN